MSDFLAAVADAEATAPASGHRITVQPVLPTGSVQWPTRKPGTAVRVVFMHLA